VLSALIGADPGRRVCGLVLKDPRAGAARTILSMERARLGARIARYEYSLSGRSPARAADLQNLALIARLSGLLMAIPKGFFPTEDTGMIYGFTQASPDISFMGWPMPSSARAAVVLQDPDVISAGSAIGGNGSSGLNRAHVHQLKPWSERKASQARSFSGCGRSLRKCPASRRFCSRWRRSASVAG